MNGDFEQAKSSLQNLNDLVDIKESIECIYC